jgi:hypothetical protein
MRLQIRIAALAAVFLARSALASEFIVLFGDGDIQQPQYLGLNDTFLGRWPDGHVPWVYNPAGAPAVFSDNNYYLGLVERAIAAWENVAGLDFEFLGVDGAALIDDFDDDVVVIGWASLPGGVGGVATASTGTASNADKIEFGYFPYRDGNVRMNLNSTWDKGVLDFTERGVVQVLLHELGHLIGLGHSDNPESAMFANPYNNLPYTTQDDIDAVVGLYGRPPVTTKPKLWPVPDSGVTSLVGDRWLTIDPQAFPPTEVASIDDAETGFQVWVYWQHDSNAVDQIEWVLVDPNGYFHEGVVGDHTGGNACPPMTTCSKLNSFARVDETKTLPGTWVLYGIEDGQKTVELPLLVDTSPSWNRPPSSALIYDRIFGTAPLTLNATVNVSQDPESDSVTVSWFVPGEGDTVDSLGAASGQSQKTMNFTDDGEYEVFATVDDAWIRYGVPGSGNAAGPGFRTVYRQVIKVGLDPAFAFVEVPDVDTDGVPELAAAIPTGTGGSAQAYVKEPLSNQLLANDPVLGSSWQLIAIDTVDNGAQIGIAALAYDGLVTRVQVRAAANGNLLRNITFLDSQWEPKGIAVLDVNEDFVDDIAVLAVNRNTGEIVAQIRESSTGAFIKNNFFLNAAWRPLDIVALEGFDLNPGPELAVLATTPEGQIVAAVKDAASNGFIRNVFYLNANWEPVDFVAIDNLPSQVEPVLALLARNRSTGKIVTMIKNASSNSFVKNVFHLSNAFTPHAVAVLEDIDANPGPEIAVIGTAGSGKIIVQLKDAETNTFIRNLVPLGSSWEAKSMRVIADVGGNSEQEVAVLARRKSDGKIVIQTIDVVNESVVNLFVP